MEKHPHSIMQIRFQDCDPMSHLNNAAYLNYFMNAREDHLLKYYGMDIYDRLKENGQSWVVAKNEILYRKPAFLMEKVKITSQVNNYSLKHIEVEMAMYNEEGKKLKALLRSVFIPFDIRKNTTIEHDIQIMDLLKSVHVSGINMNIEERLAELEGKLLVNNL